MEKDYTLGLDIGIGSVGYAILENDKTTEEPMKIIELGVRTFDVNEVLKTGESTAKGRREKRGVRRRGRRKDFRIHRLKSLLKRTFGEDILKETEKVLNKDVYELRFLALEKRIENNCLARILLHIFKRRGFESNRKRVAKEDEDGVLKKSLDANEIYLQEKQYRTIGEAFYKDDRFKIVVGDKIFYNIRNHEGSYNNCFYRKDFEKEIRTILDCQMSFGNTSISNEFTNKVIEIFNSQRTFDEGPAKSSPYYFATFNIGKCTFIPTEERAPKASFTFEYFDGLSKINKLRLNGVDLTIEQKKILYDMLLVKKEISFTDVRKALNLSGGEFNLCSYHANKKEKDLPNHEVAVKTLLDELIANHVVNSLEEIGAVGHRVVHGGEKFKDAVFITDEVIQGIKEKNRSVRLRTNFLLGYNIMDGLKFSTSLAVDYSIGRRNVFTPSYLDNEGISSSWGGTAINLMVLNENILEYKKEIKQHHSLGITAGFTYQWDQEESTMGYARNSPSDKIYYAPSGMPSLGMTGWGDYQEPVAYKHYQSDMQEKALVSYFARAEYGYKQKYLLSLAFRRDGSSTFGEKHRWGTFPSVALAWNFSEEPFIKEYVGWLSFGKVRASWGRSGLHFSQNYLALGTMSVGDTPYLGEGIIQPASLYNEELGWEETDQYDFGLDLDFIEHRLSVTIDYYYRYTDKLLASIELPGVHNGYYSQWRNAGAISNEGLEMMVRYEIFREPELYWKISLNGARNWNRFEKSYNGKDFMGRIIGKPLNGIYGWKTDGFVNYQEDVPSFYDQQENLLYLSVQGQNTLFIKPGDYRYIDIDGDASIDMDDRVYLGSALPKLSGGLTNEFLWNNIDLNMLISYSLGKHIVNKTIKRTFLTGGGYDSFVFDVKNTSFWELPGQTPDYPIWEGENIMWVSTQVVDCDVEKVNYLKLKTLTMGYTLPREWSKKIGISECRFFVSGENLLTWTNYSGADPETVDITTGIDNQDTYPLARKYTIGLTLKF